MKVVQLFPDKAVAPEDVPQPTTGVPLSVQLKSWTWLALKFCGIEWTEKVLLGELSLVRARKNLDQGAKKNDY